MVPKYENRSSTDGGFFINIKELENRLDEGLSNAESFDFLKNVIDPDLKDKIKTLQRLLPDSQQLAETSIENQSLLPISSLHSAIGHDRLLEATVPELNPIRAVAKVSFPEISSPQADFLESSTLQLSMTEIGSTAVTSGDSGSRQISPTEIDTIKSTLSDSDVSQVGPTEVSFIENGLEVAGIPQTSTTQISFFQAALIKVNTG